MTFDDLKETAAMAHLNMDDKELAQILPVFEQTLALLAPMEAAAGDKAAFPGALSTDALAGVFGNSRTVDSGFYRSANSAGAAAGNSVGSSGSAVDSGLTEKLLNNAGERDGRFLVAPNVL